MPQQTVLLGTGEGAPDTPENPVDNLFEAFTKVNSNTTELYAPPNVTTRTGSGALVIAEAGSIVEVNSASAVTITVPANATVAFPDQTQIEIHQVGAGLVTVAPATNVTLQGSPLTTPGQHKSLFLRKRGTNLWVVQ